MNEREAKQEVKLLASTSNPLKLIYSAARTCYSPDSAIEMFDKDIDDDKMLGLVEKVLNAGHESISEHWYLTFAISGVSRTLSHQHVRHRHKTFSQKSQRYVTYHKPFKYIVPQSIKNHKRKNGHYISFEVRYKEFMDGCQAFYNDMIEEGVPAEDARYIFPNACETSYVVSCNFRELAYFSNLRLCSKAQWEIRNLVNKMCELVIEKEPWAEKYLTPKCGKYLQCKEIEPCGVVNKFLERATNES